jgi:flagellar protein FliO/FliZ
MDTVSYLRFILSLLAVLAMIFGVLWAVRRWGMGLMAPRPGGGRRRRLAVVEVLQLDGRHRLVLIRRDDCEHLLLLGGTGAPVIERDCPAPHFTPIVPKPESPS